MVPPCLINREQSVKMHRGTCPTVSLLSLIYGLMATACLAILCVSFLPFAVQLLSNNQIPVLLHGICGNHKRSFRFKFSFCSHAFNTRVNIFYIAHILKSTYKRCAYLFRAANRESFPPRMFQRIRYAFVFLLCM